MSQFGFEYDVSELKKRIDSGNRIFFVSGIGTGVGKTLVSALLCRLLNADYWKPVQSGVCDGLDSDVIRFLNSGRVRIHPEKYLLDLPLSPHAAAKAEDVYIDPDKLVIPHTERPLIIEGAGGLLVPINHHGFTFADLIRQWDIPAILVSRHYLGSINHTLLSTTFCEQNHIQLAGLIFNGNDINGNEKIILERSKASVIMRIPDIDDLSPDWLQLHC